MVYIPLTSSVVSPPDSHKNSRNPSPNHLQDTGVSCWNLQCRRIFRWWSLELVTAMGMTHHLSLVNTHRYLGGGFKHFLFSPLLGEVIQFD